MNLYTVTPEFLRDSQLSRSDIRWLSPLDAPVAVHGLVSTGVGEWRRMPEDVAKSVSDGVAALNLHTAGGRLRLDTDSPFVAVRATPMEAGGKPHMAMTGSAGCDVTCNGKFAGVIRPDGMSGNTYEGLIQLAPGRKQITIGLPLYNGIRQLAIGLAAEAGLWASEPYAIECPVVFYGSSITQGGCASRPGNSYEAILSRALDMDYVNLGFSGRGMAEEPMARYIAGLRMRAFVMDYDHNAPHAQYLRMTHKRFFDIVREMQPELPILLISKPDVDGVGKNAEERRQIIRETFETARQQGDKNVWFLDGGTLFAGENREDCTVDGTHPNDFGFHRMAAAIKPVLSEMLGI